MNLSTQEKWFWALVMVFVIELHVWAFWSLCQSY